MKAIVQFAVNGTLGSRVPGICTMALGSATLLPTQQQAQNPTIVSQGETAPSYLIYEEYAKPKGDAYKQLELWLQSKTSDGLLLNILAGYFCTHLLAN